MKQVTTVILATLIFLLPFSKTWLVVSFQINRDFIAKTLCIKKEIENNTCQGKCYLKKQLDKEQKKEQAPNNKNEKFEVLYCQAQIAFEFIPLHLFFEKQPINSYYSVFYVASFITSIFHPPPFSLI